MGVIKRSDDLVSSSKFFFPTSIKFSVELGVAFFLVMNVFFHVSQARAAKATNVACENITLQKCLGEIQDAYSVKIATNIDFSSKKINTTLSQESPLKAVETLLGLADISNYTISQDADSNIFILDITKPSKSAEVENNTSITKHDNPSVTYEVKSEVGASPSLQNPMMYIPTPEQLEVLKAKAKEVEQNLDRKIDIPGVDSSKTITVRQLIQLQEQATVRSPTKNEILHIPGVPEDKSITYGQAMEKKNEGKRND